MQIYEKKSDYLVSYRIQDDKIIQHYYRDDKEYIIPNIQHNIEFCNNKLRKQFDDITPYDIRKLEKDRNDAISSLCVPGICMIYLSVSLSPFLFVFSVPYILTNICRVVNKTYLIKHFELTSFCIEHILEINEIVNGPNGNLKLSKKAQKVLSMDHGFTLNHSDEYRVSDMKKIKKVLSR